MKRIFIIIAIVVSGLSAFNTTNVFAAADCTKDPKAAGCPCAVNPNSTVCKQLVKETSGSSFDATLKAIINTLLFGIGMVSVIMIIVGSIRFTSSRGTPDVVSKARLTIVYSVAGLVVAILAYAIISFVVGRF